MLCLARKCGESVYIGENKCVFNFNSKYSPFVFYKDEKKYFNSSQKIILDDVTIMIKLDPRNGRQYKVGFDAPRHINIVRSELLMKHRG